ncbi:glycosyltransferase family 9 protein [Lacibacterium aquatile]|uniref:Glycosyltransferase family 9 protein n=1 Tax=Lacibacterium aquatile TaxID=1168082 RepID=A0ABW5DNS9_9PROT
MPGKKRLLFITSTRIGDAVLGSGVLARVLEEMPGALVTVAGGPLVKPLFDGLPGLERFIPLVKRRHSLHWLGLWRETVGTYWDTVLDLRGSVIGYSVPRRRLICWSGRRVGEGHQVERFGRLLGLDSPPAPCLFPSSEQIAKGKALLPSDRSVLALGPTANGRGKEWPQERFATLARWIVSQDGPLPGAAIAIFGAPSDRTYVQPLVDALDGQTIIDGFGYGDLGVTGQAIGGCSLFVGNDSGLMHIAAASGVPTFGLFGASPSERYAPWGANAGYAASPVDPDEAIRRLIADKVWPMDWLTLDQVQQGLTDFWAAQRR